MKTRLLDHAAVSERPPAERPRGVAPAPLRPGHAHAAEVLRDLKPRPFPGLMASCGAAHAACVLADAILDDLSDLAENIIDLVEPLKAAMADHTDRMLLMPWLARITELLTVAAPAAPAVAAAPQPAPVSRHWGDPVTNKDRMADAQRKATLASWNADSVGDPHNPPAEVVRQMEMAARIFAGLETTGQSSPAATDEYQPPANPDRTRRRHTAKPYTAAQLDGAACAECGHKFAEDKPARPTRDARGRQVLVHSDETQCEVAK